MNAAFKALTEEEQCHLVDKVAHVGDGEAFARREYELDFAEIENFMLDHNYERCRNCRWFVECHELVTDYNDPKFCDECQPRTE
jgi:hypothetical protein